MILSVGSYVLDIDVNANRSFYKQAKTVSEQCTCDGCKNYELAVRKAPYRTKRFFKKVGVDMKRPAEVYAIHTENGLLHYGGFYHLCGKIVKGDSPWKIITDNTKVLEEERMIRHGCFRFGFVRKCVLVDEKFPMPAFQMDIIAQLPWLLQKENTYF